jgi:hypothetical protein
MPESVLQPGRGTCLVVVVTPIALFTIFPLVTYIPQRFLVIGDWRNKIIAIMDIVCTILCGGALSAGLFLAGQYLENMSMPGSSIGFGIWLMMFRAEFALAMVTVLFLLGFHFNMGARIPSWRSEEGGLARHARNWPP